jgi:oxalate decarboxylase/phosphoglucose isomerase-like protein (cupin superfamily)
MQWVEVSVGDLIEIPSNAKHAFRNRSQNPERKHQISRPSVGQTVRTTIPADGTRKGPVSQILLSIEARISRSSFKQEESSFNIFFQKASLASTGV